ncbi:MAG: hypothetical protein U5L98_10640 [Halomonas sp.]|nr:hypothetical protein [Halomonas sp.]MDZ7853076.1 hypothetical protein [Halomonas sp.]
MIEEEIDYLLSVVNAHFRTQLSRDAVIRTFSALHPLCDDASLGVYCQG